jgi:predicted porin
MRKTAIAIALAAACAGAAHAQSSVTVYGAVDLGLVLEHGGAAGSVTKLSSGVEAGSRLGFKGVEDLGGGYFAKFALEMGISADNGSLNQGGTAFGRQSLVGLGGGFGTVTMGRQYTPLFLALDSVDPFGTGLAGTSTNLFAFYPTSGNARMTNSVIYTSPALSGFSGMLAYGFGEVPGNSSAKRQLGASLSYENGPWLVTVAHHRTNDATGNDSDRTTLAGGAFDFGMAKVHVVYDTNKGIGGVDNHDLLFGVSAPVAGGTLMASYIRKSDKSGLRQNANQAAIGFTYPISKRTNFYTAYGRIENENGAAYTVGNAIDSGTGDKAFNFGIRHKF